MNNYAYFTLISTDNYLYGCIGLGYSGKRTESKYPFYCIVTDNLKQETIDTLEAIGFNIIKEPKYAPQSYLDAYANDSRMNEEQRTIGTHVWNKLDIFKYTQFDKILFLDADTFVLQNMDGIFEKPAWSGVPEWGSYDQGCYMFFDAMIFIHPDIDVYNKLIERAEKDAYYLHPKSQQMVLGTDDDLLNEYIFNEYNHNKKLHLPMYTYVDGYALAGNKNYRPYGIHNWFKINAIHLTGAKKPGMLGLHYYDADRNEEWALGKLIYSLYLEMLNMALVDIHNKYNIDVPLIK